MTKFNFQNATIKTVRLLGVTTIAVTLAAAHPGAHADQRPALVDNANHSDVSTAVGTVNAFHAALANGNTAAALSLLAEDVIIYESGNVESSRAEYASHHVKADAAFSAAVKRTLIDRSQGETGDAAWVLSVETVTGTYRNRAINMRSVETMILHRNRGHWRIAHIHWSSGDLKPRVS